MSEITVAVSAPKSIPAPSVVLTFRPATVDEFDAIVEACGGVLTFGRLNDFVYGRIGEAQVHVNFPSELAPLPVDTPSARFGLDFDRRRDEAEKGAAHVREALGL